MDSEPQVIELLGGPADGEVVVVPKAPTAYIVALAPPMADVLATDPFAPLAIDEVRYVPRMDATGCQSRRDNGDLVYEAC